MGAFVLGPMWFAAHRMWAALIIWSAITVCIAIASTMFAVGLLALLPTAIVLFGFLALEHGALKQAALRRRGYQLVDVVEGTHPMDAELSFCARLTSSSRQQPQEKTIRQPARSAEAVGLFLQERN